MNVNIYASLYFLFRMFIIMDSYHRNICKVVENAMSYIRLGRLPK